MKTQFDHIIKDHGIITERNQPFGACLTHERMTDQRGKLAQKLLEVSMIAPKYNGMDKPAQLEDVDRLVTRAFDAADLFYLEADKRGCMVDLPSQDDIQAANDAAKDERDARKAIQAA